MTRPYHPSPGLRASDIVWPRTDGYEPLEPASGNHFHTCACGAVWEHAIPEGDTCGDSDNTCEACSREDNSE